MQNDSDEKIIAQVMQGDVSQYGILSVKYSPLIKNYLRKMIGNTETIHDLLQDTHVRVIEKLQQPGAYTHKGKFGGWIVRIAHNLTVDYLRKLVVWKKVDHETYDNTQLIEKVLLEKNKTVHSIEKKFVTVADTIELSALLEKLPEVQKEVVVLRIYAELPFREIAALTNVSINTSLGRMRYALLNLRKLAPHLYKKTA